MRLFHKVLDKAREEGKINTCFRPWDGSAAEAGGIETALVEAQGLMPRLGKISGEMQNDFQMVIENIRSKVAERDAHIIGITSAVPGHGSSTLAALLSLMIAESERSYLGPFMQKDEKLRETEAGILLVDAQVRNPLLHTMLEVPAKGGLHEILSGTLPYKEAIKEVEGSRLKLVTIGNEKGFRYTQAHMEKFKAFLGKMVQSGYEFVLLDIPPILHYAEGLALSNLCDGIVFVVSAGRGRMEVVKEAKRLMERARVPILGAVLNRREYFIPDWIYKRL